MRDNIIRKSYDWVLGWAESKYADLALFILALAESSFFPIPPDVLLIALCLGNVNKSMRYAFICLTGSIIGAIGGYYIGFECWVAMHDWFIPSIFTQEGFDSVGAMYEKWNFWAVFTAGCTPIPYKIFTIAAGVFNINFLMFIVASIVGRGFRFFLIAGLIYKFGTPIKGFIDKYFNLVVSVFTILLIGSFVIIKYVL